MSLLFPVFVMQRISIACYQDDDITQNVAADVPAGKTGIKGQLPVSVCQFSHGAGIIREDEKSARMAEGRETRSVLHYRFNSR